MTPAEELRAVRDAYTAANAGDAKRAADLLRALLQARGETPDGPPPDSGDVAAARARTAVTPLTGGTLLGRAMGGMDDAVRGAFGGRGNAA